MIAQEHSKFLSTSSTQHRSHYQPWLLQFLTLCWDSGWIYSASNSLRNGSSQRRTTGILITTQGSHSSELIFRFLIWSPVILPDGMCQGEGILNIAESKYYSRANKSNSGYCRGLVRLPTIWSRTRSTVAIDLARSDSETLPTSDLCKSPRNRRGLKGERPFGWYSLPFVATWSKWMRPYSKWWRLQNALAAVVWEIQCDSNVLG